MKGLEIVKISVILPQPRNDALAPGVNVAHERNLRRFLGLIALIDADSVNPEVLCQPAGSDRNKGVIKIPPDEDPLLSSRGSNRQGNRLAAVFSLVRAY